MFPCMPSLPIDVVVTFVWFEDEQRDSAGDLVQEAQRAVDEGASVYILPYQRALQPNCRHLLRTRCRVSKFTDWRSVVSDNANPVVTMTRALAVPMTMARGYIRLLISLGRKNTATPEMTQSVAPMVRRDFRRRLFHLISCNAYSCKYVREDWTEVCVRLLLEASAKAGPVGQRTPRSCSRRWWPVSAEGRSKVWGKKSKGTTT